MIRINKIRRNHAGQSLKQWRSWFDEVPPTPAPEPQPTPTPADKSGEDKRFTQAEVDAMMGERAKRAAEAAVSKLLTDLGYEKPEDLKKDTAAAKKAKEEQMSELEKANEKLAAIEKAKLEAETQLANERQSRLLDRRNSAITAAAQKARAEAPDDVVLWAEKHAADQLAKVLKEDGSVDEKAVNTLIEKCRTERKNWFTGSAPGSPSNRDGRNPTPDLTKFEGVPKIRL